jgi:hypothetical protein
VDTAVAYIRRLEAPWAVASVAAGSSAGDSVAVVHACRTQAEMGGRAIELTDLGKGTVLAEREG